MTVTVTCLFVRGEYPYTVEYVERLYAMVKRWMDRPFRFVCLTDQPWLFQAPIETVPVNKLAGFAPWTKLELFNPKREWAGRMLYLDLDSLIVAPLAPIIDIHVPYNGDWISQPCSKPIPVEAAFAITSDPPSQASPRRRDSFGRQIVRRFNSSVMVWDGGTQTDLFTAWKPHVTQRLSGDQDWVGEQRPNAVTLPRAWFPRLSEAVQPPWLPDAKVIFCKVPKNAIAAQEHDWFAPLWGAA